jgi:hypothetical protein
MRGIATARLLRLLAAVFVALVLGAVPARAAIPPTQQQDGWGHFWGCFSIILDSVAHAQYCGPSNVPRSAIYPPPGEADQPVPPPPPPPPPDCVPCGGAFLDHLGDREVLVAQLGEYWLPPPRVRSNWMLLACCPPNNS